MNFGRPELSFFSYFRWFFTVAKDTLIASKAMNVTSLRFR